MCSSAAVDLQAGQVLVLYATPLGLLLRRNDVEQAAFLPNAHVWMRSLGSAASTTTAVKHILCSGSRRSVVLQWVVADLVTSLAGGTDSGVPGAAGGTDSGVPGPVCNYFVCWGVL